MPTVENTSIFSIRIFICHTFLYIYICLYLCIYIVLYVCIGFLSASTSPLCVTALGASVCALGRWMHKASRYLLMSKHECYVVYGDTDSLMVIFSLRNKPANITTRNDVMNYIADLATEAGKDCTALFKAPNVFELECFKSPMLMLPQKKNYVAVEFGIKKDCWDATVNGHFLMKGIVLTKRDRCPVVRYTGKEIMHRIVFEHYCSDIEIRKYLEGVVATFEARPADVSQFIITCAIAETYKSSSVIGITLKMQIEEDSGATPLVGTRIPFVVIVAPGKKHFESVTTVDRYIADKNIKLDMKYYLEKQLLQSFKNVLVHHPNTFKIMSDVVNARVMKLNMQTTGQTLLKF